MDLIRRLHNWKPDPGYLQELQDATTSPADAMQQLWNVCDGILRIRLSAAAILVGLGSALMAMYFGTLSQLIHSNGPDSSQPWLCIGYLLGVVMLLFGAIASYFAACAMFSIVTKITRYYQDEVCSRWLQEDD